MLILYVESEPGPESESGSCTDTNDGAVDPYGDDCSVYTIEAESGWSSGRNWCGAYNDDDFDSNAMCCICDGGASTGLQPVL